MKTFDLKKTGILLVIMLVAGVVLVGPVSAGSVTERSDYGYYDVTANGNALSQTSLSYYGKAVTVSGENSDRIIVNAVLYSSGGTYIDWESKTIDDTNRVFTDIGYNSGSDISGYQVWVSLQAVNENDQYYYAKYRFP